MTAVNTQKLESIYSYLKEAGIAATAMGGDGFINTIWSTAEDVKKVASKDPNAKAQGTQELIRKALDLISTLIGMNNEKSEATETKNENKEDINKIEEARKALIKELSIQVDAIVEDIDKHIALINEASAKIENRKEAFEEAKTELEKIKSTIETKREELRSAKTSGKAKSILEEIKKLAGQIPCIVYELELSQDELEEESQKVAKAYTAVEVLKGNSVDIQTNAQNEIAVILDKTAQEIVENTKEGATGVENAGNASLCDTAGTAATASGVAAAAAPKLFTTGADQGAAAIVRISGSADNIANLMNDMNKIKETNSSIDGLIRNVDGAIVSSFGSSISKWNSLIKSFGSIKVEEITEASSELLQYVDNDLANLGNVDENSKAEKTATTSSLNNSDNYDNNYYETLNFDMQKLKFGI